MADMGFSEAVRTVFSKYATFSGRAGREEFWWFALFNVLGSAVADTLDRAFFGTRMMWRGYDGMMWGWHYQMMTPSVLGGIFSLVVLMPSLAVGARRLHDVGLSGWWLLLVFLPVIGWIILLVWTVQRGEKGANAYGPDPLGAT